MQESSVLVTNDLEYAIATICDGTLTNSSVNILLENKSVDTVLYYGPNGYSLEQMINGTWFRVPSAVTTRSGVAIYETVRPVQSKNWSVDWSYYYGELTTGQYRFIVSIVVNEIDLSDETYETEHNVYNPEKRYYLSVPFSID